MRTNYYWWKKAFGEIYLSAFDSLYSRARTAREVGFLIKMLHLRQNEKILDIPCGQGRHSIEFAKRGFHVTGVDFSPTLIRVSSDRARAQHVVPRFIRGDIRSVQLRERYDAILVLGNSFGYFSDSDNEKVITNLSRFLARGGFLVLDLPNTVGMLRRLETKRKLQIPHGYILVDETLFDPRNLTVQLRWTIVQSGKRTIFPGRLRLYTFPEIRTLLLKNGLRVTKLFGSFGGMAYTLQAPRMIVIAQKF